jgi:hypothetical protein
MMSQLPDSIVRRIVEQQTVVCRFLCRLTGGRIKSSSLVLSAVMPAASNVAGKREGGWSRMTIAAAL